MDALNNLLTKPLPAPVIEFRGSGRAAPVVIAKRRAKNKRARAARRIARKAARG